MKVNRRDDGAYEVSGEITSITLDRDAIAQMGARFKEVEAKAERAEARVQELEQASRAVIAEWHKHGYYDELGERMDDLARACKGVKGE